MRLYPRYLLAAGGLLLAGGYAATRSPSFGSFPTAEQVERYKASPHFDAHKGIFVNRRPDLVETMRQRDMRFGKLVKQMWRASEDVTPKSPLPTVTPDFSAFQQPEDALKVMWLGHSSILLNIEGQRVLIDPVLSQRTGPLGFMMRRFQAPVVTPEALPPIDLILITHDHYDHLDMGTIRAFQNTATRFVVPLGVSAHLLRWGIPVERIQELDWWQATSFKDLKVTATPAQHFSGRHLVKQSHSLWASWVIQSPNHRLYFSGDSGYDSHFKAIGEALGPFDLAFIESGQYSPLWPAVHLHPAESIQAFQDLNAKRYFPIHWGMFRLSTHAWYEPIRLLTAEAKRQGIVLVAPKMGEIALINGEEPPDPWWESVISGPD